MSPFGQERAFRVIEVNICFNQEQLFVKNAYRFSIEPDPIDSIF